MEDPTWFKVTGSKVKVKSTLNLVQRIIHKSYYFSWLWLYFTDVRNKNETNIFVE